MNKYTIGIIVFIAIIGGAFLSMNKKSSTPVSITPGTGVSTSTTPGAKSYTLADIAQHPNATSCWTTIGGEVYDLTSFVSGHPGGEKNILKVCGKDGTSLFEGQHGSDSKPQNVLAGFIIGSLKQ